MTFAIGAPIQTVASDIKAGICYDVDYFKLKFISFIAQSNSEAIIFDEVGDECYGMLILHNLSIFPFALTLNSIFISIEEKP